MRIILLLAASLTCCAASFAPEGTGAAPAKSSVPLNDARMFAMQLNRVIEMTAGQYVRPISRDVLARAALKGLYESARMPLPASFHAELERLQQQSELIEYIDNASAGLIGQLPQEQQNSAVRALLLVREANNAERLALFIKAREQLGDVEALRGHEALFASIRGLLKLLDPYCGLTSNREWMRSSADDLAPGFGFEVNPNLGVGPLVVKDVVPGSPAQKAGLRPGDRITQIGGKQVNAAANAEALILVGAQQVNIAAPPAVPPPVPPPGKAMPIPSKPAAPKPLELAIQRDTEQFKVTLEPEAFRGETVLGVVRNDDNTWDYWIDRKHKIAHVRIASLAAGTSEELVAVVNELQSAGLRGLVLDLRWCPGGLLPEAVNVALFFVGSRRVAKVKGRDGREIEYNLVTELPARSAKKEAEISTVPLFVLVNGATSGGAELIAAAIQDNHRGKIAGQRTLGKASVQTAFDLVDNTKLKLSTGTFIRPSGKNLNRFPDSKDSDEWGVRPDAGCEFRISPEAMRQLRDWWQRQTLRPGPSCQVLPLDDPAADSQRQAAVDWLLKHPKREKHQPAEEAEKD
jgi:carboxyl-terminal processing protease